MKTTQQERDNLRREVRGLGLTLIQSTIDDADECAAQVSRAEHAEGECERMRDVLREIGGQPCHWEAGDKTFKCDGGRTDCDPCTARAALSQNQAAAKGE